MRMEFTDRILTCADCGEVFTFSAGEQLFFSEKQFQHDPKRCKRCKADARHGRVRAETAVRCAECGTTTIVPFVPRQSRPVLCRVCLHQKRPQQQHDEPARAGTAALAVHVPAGNQA